MYIQNTRVPSSFLAILEFVFSISNTSFLPVARGKSLFCSQYCDKRPTLGYVGRYPSFKEEGIPSRKGVLEMESPSIADAKVGIFSIG